MLLSPQRPPKIQVLTHQHLYFLHLSRNPLAPNSSLLLVPVLLVAAVPRHPQIRVRRNQYRLRDPTRFPNNIPGLAAKSPRVMRNPVLLVAGGAQGVIPVKREANQVPAVATHLQVAKMET